mmetsp:Transcript_70201/g.124039  ORF Transcript_70201/g.124039 Transcript_70201/m.124039 type:complete len:116 (-) Transcript_70201:114-461(-)
MTTETATGHSAAASSSAVNPPVELEPVPMATEEAPSQPRGLGRRILGIVGGLGYRIVDNMSFVGEVLVDFLDLDKPAYHKEIEDLKKQKKKLAKAKELKEAEEIASIEAPVLAVS